MYNEEKLAGVAQEHVRIIPGTSFSAIVPAVSRLECPLCGHNYQHVRFSEVEHVKSDDDYSAGWFGRGSLLRIPVWGECDHEWNLLFGFHKGETFVFTEV